MKLKVCGITQPEQLLALEAMGVHFAGFIFYRASKRYAGMSPGLKRQTRDAQIQRVGVFVDAAIEEILQTAKEFHLQLVQLHGEESPAFCAELRKHLPVIKAIAMNGQVNLDEVLDRYGSSCDYFLFDTKTDQKGGSGQKFDWHLLDGHPIGKKFFLSGGIGPADVAAINGFSHACLWGIDINSRFETEPGIKNLGQVKIFMEDIL